VSEVLIVVHHERQEGGALANAAATWLRAHGHTPWMTEGDIEALGLTDLRGEHDPRHATAVVTLGGDGTVLRAIDLLDGASVPVIAVNVGVLGYLTEVEPPAMTNALERFFAGDCVLEHRMLLHTEIDRNGVDTGGAGHGPHRWRALNEAVLEKLESGHTVRLGVRIDGAPFTSYAADGLIIATPTGSTAYSLSARGPVISPTHRAMLMTPVSPHMLFDRALVLAPEEVIEIEVIGHRGVVLSIDGRLVETLGEGDIVRCRPAVEESVFVRFGRRRFHQILKAKFGLSDR
jgi:NAD+ kinase